MPAMKCGSPDNPSGPCLTSFGLPCERTVTPGSNRCFLHGGASPSSLLRAQVALAALRQPAVDILFNAMVALHTLIEQMQGDICPTCNFPRGSIEEKEQLVKAAVGAAKSSALVLDRTGLGPKATLEVQQSDGNVNLSLMTNEERAELHGIMTQFRALKERMRERLTGIIDVTPAALP